MSKGDRHVLSFRAHIVYTSHENRSSAPPRSPSFPLTRPWNQDCHARSAVASVRVCLPAFVFAQWESAHGRYLPPSARPFLCLSRPAKSHTARCGRLLARADQPASLLWRITQSCHEKYTACGAPFVL